MTMKSKTSYILLFNKKIKKLPKDLLNGIEFFKMLNLRHLNLRDLYFSNFRTTKSHIILTSIWK